MVRNRDELERPVKRELSKGDLQPDHDGKMDQVEPVGRIGDVANDLAWFVEKTFEQSDAKGDEGPHHQRVAERESGANQPEMRMPYIGLVAGQHAGAPNNDDAKGDSTDGQSGKTINEPFLSMQQPAEGEESTVDDENGPVRNEGFVGSVHSPNTHMPEASPSGQGEKEPGQARVGDPIDYQICPFCCDRVKGGR